MGELTAPERPRYAYHYWRAPSPRYVLLLGDGTYDYKDFLNTGVAGHVPAYLIKTSFLWTASDPTLASVNGDDLLPDLAVGRLPAANREEARQMIEKAAYLRKGAFSELLTIYHLLGDPAMRLRHAPR